MTVETEVTPISPDPVTIMLKLQSSSPFQIPQPLPVSSCGTAPQEPDAQGKMTSFTQTVTAPQEPVTHPEAETQEPATEVQESYTKHDNTRKPVVAKTQEPTTAADQQSTLEKTTNTQGSPTMASLLEENEFLKSELEAYKKELIMAREAFDRELNLYMLAHTTSAQKKDPCREYMCHECGNIYQQAGYKIVKIPVPEASTSVTIKEERPTVTQEPLGSSKILEKKPNHRYPTLC